MISGNPRLNEVRLRELDELASTAMKHGRDLEAALISDYLRARAHDCYRRQDYRGSALLLRIARKIDAKEHRT